MSRAERRRKNKTVDKLSFDEMNLLNEFVEEKAATKAHEMLEDIATVINECFIKAMRANGIGLVRAHTILRSAEALIKEESEKTQ